MEITAAAAQATVGVNQLDSVLLAELGRRLFSQIYLQSILAGYRTLLLTMAHDFDCKVRKHVPFGIQQI